MGGTDDKTLRTEIGRMTAAEFRKVSVERGLEHWRATNRFCGRCGAGMERHPDPAERAFKCPSCGFAVYPHVSPAVIALVEKDGKILLQRNPRLPVATWSLVAGFVEPGESLEEAMRREIREEASIEVKNLRYFGSQPWPFPSNLMVGFLADWDSGELKPDGKEIAESGWFSPDSMPPLPLPGSIARKMIDAFVAKRASQGA